MRRSHGSSLHGDDLIGASRTLFYDFLQPLADEAGKPVLVEMSCFTIAAADGLAEIFPEARFVHTVRDGRDSGSSKVSLRQKQHHPTDVASGIEFWAGRLRQAEEGVRGLSAADRERLHVISLDELVDTDREASYAGLIEFLGVDDEPAMREFFETRDERRRGHQGRWRRGSTELEQDEIVRLYEATLERLEREGYHCAPSAPLLRAHRSSSLSLDADPLHDLERDRARPPDTLDGDRPPARRRGRAALPHPLGAAPVVGRMGFPVEYVASYATPGSGNDYRWSRRLRARLRAAVAEADPAVVVFDGTHPYEALLGALPSGARAVWCRRPLWKQGSSRAPLGRAGAFDAVLEPGELAEDEDRGPTVPLRAGRSASTRSSSSTVASCYPARGGRRARPRPRALARARRPRPGRRGPRGDRARTRSARAHRAPGRGALLGDRLARARDGPPASSSSRPPIR